MLILSWLLDPDLRSVIFKSYAVIPNSEAVIPDPLYLIMTLPWFTFQEEFQAFLFKWLTLCFDLFFLISGFLWNQSFFGTGHILGPHFVKLDFFMQGPGVYEMLFVHKGTLQFTSLCLFIGLSPKQSKNHLYQHSIPENHSFPVWTYISGYYP